MIITDGGSALKTRAVCTPAAVNEFEEGKIALYRIAKSEGVALWA